MMNAVSNDMIIMDLTNALGTVFEISRLSEVKSILYMFLGNKKIFVEKKEEQLPASYIDDTARIIDVWLQCLRLEKRTERTIENYRGEMINFFKHVNKHYADVTTNDVRMYLAWRQQVHHNSDTTINNKIHVLYSFYGWVMNEDLIEEGGFISRRPKKNPMSKIHISKVEMKKKRVLTDEQLELIRCGCKTERDLAIVDLLAGTGMRIGELVKLNRDDIDFREGRCIVYGKGRKERPAYLTGRAIVHLQQYLESRKDREAPLFINNRRSRKSNVENIFFGRMSDDSIRNMLKAICKRDERLKNVNLHPHMFRAYLATSMSRRGARSEDIQLILGHSSVDTTIKYYVVRDDKCAAEAHGKYAA